MLKRIITGACFLSILLPLVIIENQYVSILYLILCMFLGFYGCLEMLRNSKIIPKLKYLYCSLCSFIVFLASNATNEFSTNQSFNGFVYLILFYIFSIFLVYGIILFVKDSTINDYGYVIQALTYCGLFLGLAFSLKFFNPQVTSFINITGRVSFLFCYIIVLLTDTFAYLIGIKFGKHKVAPHISPKKSVEGCIGGLVFGVVFGFVSLVLFKILKEYTFVSVFTSIIVLILLSSSVQIGDLVESKMKRSLNIKDFGNILPGHGGILDRFDSFIYSGVLFYLILMTLEVVITWN